MARARTAPATDEPREGIEVPADGTEVELPATPAGKGGKGVEMTWRPSRGFEEYHGNGVSLYPGEWEVVPTDLARYLLEEFPNNAKAK